MNEDIDISSMTLEKKRALLSNLLKQGQDKPEMEPLSFPQERIWFMEQLHPNTATHNIPTAIPMQGMVDADILERALQEIVDRHETLRTTFLRRGLEPVQVIWQRQELLLDVQDLRQMPESKRQQEMNNLSVEAAVRPFDLSRGPLLRVVLVRLTDSEATLLLTMHHIISDGWSMGILRSELDTLYTAFAANQPSPLPPLTFQYRDFVKWQREQLSGNRLAQHLAYWRQQLKDAPQHIALPADKPRPAIQSSDGWVKPFSIKSSVTDRIREISKAEGATLFMTMLAMFFAFLYRHSGQNDLVVGAPVASRNKAEVEPLIGFFVNTLVLRLDLDSSWTFRQLLQTVRKVALDVYGHQELPFEKIVEDLHTERDLSVNPITQVVFAFQGPEMSTGPVPQMDLPVSPTQTAKFDITLGLGEVGDTLSGAIECNAGIFNADTAERFVSRFIVLVNAISENPDQCIDQLPILPPEEEHQLLVNWNSTDADFPNACFHEVFESQVDVRPDFIAAEAGEQCLTYADLDAKANQLAHYLRRMGVNLEARVAICLERGIDVPIAVLGVMKSAAAYVPLDPRAPQRRNHFILQDAAAELVITQSSLASLFQSSGLPVICLDSEVAAIAKQSRDRPKLDIDPFNLAYTIYTSGSTGEPKGIYVPHRGVVNMGMSEVDDFGIQAGDRLQQMAPLIFDVSIWEMAMAWFCGATIVFASEEEIVSGDALISKKINKSAFTPSLLSSLDPSRFPDLGTVLSVGEACTPQIVRKWAQNRRLVNVYGPTETTGHCMTIDLVPEERITIGRPIQNARVYVLNESLQLAPIGVSGEIHISSAGMTRGYVGRPELTAERFIPDPFSKSPNGRLYKTGDLGRVLPDGRIEYLGRSDHQVKLRGFRIELGEIEAVLREIPGVSEAVAVLREDQSEIPRLVAYVVADKDNPLDHLDIRAQLRDQLPDYMIPADLMMLDQLPLNINRKVDRAALPDPRASEEIPLRNRSAALKGETQVVVAGIWQELLGKEVGPKDNFFDLGGHSLLATQVLVRISDMLHVDVPMRVIFQCPVLEELAHAVDESRANGQMAEESIQPIERNAPLIDVAQTE